MKLYTSTPVEAIKKQQHKNKTNSDIDTRRSNKNGQRDSTVQSVVCRGCEFEPQLSHIPSVEIDHEMLSVVILLIPPIFKMGSCQLLTKVVHKYWVTT